MTPVIPWQAVSLISRRFYLYPYAGLGSFHCPVFLLGMVFAVPEKEEFMAYDRIPLEEQLKKAADGRIVFPEYTACAIRAWADTPIATYLGGNSEKGEERRQEIRTLLGISLMQEKDMCYRDVAERIAARMQTEELKQDAEKALYILAEPLAAAYTKWKEERHAKDTKNPT